MPEARNQQVVNGVTRQAEGKGGELGEHVGLDAPQRAARHLLLAPERRLARFRHGGVRAERVVLGRQPRHQFDDGADLRHEGGQDVDARLEQHAHEQRVDGAGERVQLAAQLENVRRHGSPDDEVMIRGQRSQDAEAIDEGLGSDEGHHRRAVQRAGVTHLGVDLELLSVVRVGHHVRHLFINGMR